MTSVEKLHAMGALSVGMRVRVVRGYTGKEAGEHGWSAYHSVYLQYSYGPKATAGELLCAVFTIDGIETDGPNEISLRLCEGGRQGAQALTLTGCLEIADEKVEAHIPNRVGQ